MLSADEIVRLFDSGVLIGSDTNIATGYSIVPAAIANGTHSLTVRFEDVAGNQSGLSGTITLTSGQLELYDSVDIQGPGPATLTVSGNNASRVFYIYSPANGPIDVTISGLTITAGTDASEGGGVVDWGENLTLDNDVITNNATGGSGGGVARSNSPER